MKIESLSIHDFRGIRELELSFGPGVNVLVGTNGAGKSAVLDCAAILLSRFIWRVRSSTGTGRFFTESDINNHSLGTRNEVAVGFRGASVRWTVAKPKRGHKRQTITRLKDLKEQVARLHDDLAGEPSTPLPIAVYYPVNRAVLDIPLRIRRRHQFDRMAAYDQALSGDWSSFRVFFEWFRMREDLENERRVGRAEHRDPQLQAVRTAIARFLPEFADLRVERSPLRMVVRKAEEELVVSQLSDGEKCMLAMVGDLARRMAVANPDMESPLDTEAVVLIDELDLHLHPAWQRLVPDALAETFPNTQFIASTHSPAIVSHLKPESVWMLEREGAGVVARQPETTYGQRAGRILEDVMGVVDRPAEVKARIASLFAAIDAGRLDDAVRCRDELWETVGRDPEITRADTLIHRGRVLGR